MAAVKSGIAAVVTGLLMVLCTDTALSQSRSPVTVALRDSTRSRLAVDSANWSEAWIEVMGSDAKAKQLVKQDLRVTDGHDTARILSIDSIAAAYSSKLSLSFVLDNSASMFHSYDSLVKYLDTLVTGLPPGVVAQAITFDNDLRSRTDRYTAREAIYLSSSGFTSSLDSLRRFWHYYDSVRVGYTPFFDAMELAVELMEDDSRPQVLIGVTDGEDNASSVSVNDLGRLIHGSNIRLILISLNANSQRLRWLAKVSRGSLYNVEDVDDLRNLLHDLGLTMTRSYHVRYQFPSLTPSSPIRH